MKGIQLTASALPLLAAMVAPQPALSAEADRNMLECAKFTSELPRLTCFETVARHAQDPSRSMLIVIAPRPPVVPPPPTPMDNCRAVFDLAHATMIGRQTGVAMPDMIALTSTELSGDVVRSAYATPRYTTADFQQAAATDFANEYYAECLRLIDP
jgi:hypothetical protein